MTAEVDSPLYDAVRHTDVEMIQLLLDGSADANAFNAAGEIPEDLLPRGEEGTKMQWVFRWADRIGRPSSFKRQDWPSDVLNKGKESREEARSMPAKKAHWSRLQCSLGVPICQDFKAYVEFCWKPRGTSWGQNISGFELLYEGHNALDRLEEQFIDNLRILEHSSGAEDEIWPVREDIWRWIHFPANNVSAI